MKFVVEDVPNGLHVVPVGDSDILLESFRVRIPFLPGSHHLHT